ncbi:MAG: diacylglycerol kinase [Armatimonadetes bacterium]|nr:diacylglycerol kinase [Armatimonadota bacterium]
MAQLRPQVPRYSGHHKSTRASFRHAWEGLEFAFVTQKHMRVHAVIIALVVIAAVGLDVPPLPLLHLFSAMALVIIAELINTAIEYAVDLAVEHYDPRAKLAKDVAAAAVLVAAAYSIVVGVIVFGYHSRLLAMFQGTAKLARHPWGTLQVAAVGTVVVALIALAVKYFSHKGEFARGGPISGHTALGFFLATVIAFVTGSLSVAILSLALALLIGQSRVQAGVHSVTEVLLGGLAGMAVGLLLLMIVPK